MAYRIEIFDTEGKRIATCENSPLLEATRMGPDGVDTIRGLLPSSMVDLSHGYLVKIFVNDVVFCEGRVRRVMPQWSDTQKLILDRYVSFHEVIEFEATADSHDLNTHVTQTYTGWPIDAMVKHLIQCAPGKIHYSVAHSTYPDGAQREYGKFLARKTLNNELGIGGITHGQWVGRPRLNLSGTYAKDGDTIAGLVVDGVAWPEIRLMMIDSEETSRNSHGIAMHGEVAQWTTDRYAASGYKLRGEAAKAALQALIDTHGIDFIELNPHRDTQGQYDNRIDEYGRYQALVYGSGQCFNAAQVECGHASVYLYDEGAYLPQEMALKDYYSYEKPSKDSIDAITETLSALDVDSGIFNVLTALAYAANGCVWSLGVDGCVSFRRIVAPSRVMFYDPLLTRIGLGSDSREMTNILYFGGNPTTGGFSKTYQRNDSINEYGAHTARLDYYAITLPVDADKLAQGLLNDLAYPEPCGVIELYAGDPHVQTGDIVEVRDAPLRRLERRMEGEWNNLFGDRLVGRVRQVTHRFSGRAMSTTLLLTSPLRSVANPLGVMVSKQEKTVTLFGFRLDDQKVALDLGYHLD